MRFHLKKGLFINIALIAAVMFVGFSAYRCAPRAVAAESSWGDTTFGPLNGLEQSVYSQTMADYQDSF